VEVGIILGDVPASLPPRDHLDALLRQVEAAQRNGITYITIGQHYVYGDIRWLQPIPTLARLCAEVDDHVKIGTMVLEVPLYHPIALAEEIATLDILCGGRLVIGAGAGYREAEFTAFGIDFKRRFAMMDESLQLMKMLWTQEEVTFHGKFWQVEGVRPHIQPRQLPHPPIWIGALRESGVRRSARLGDGWPVTPETRVPEAIRLMGIYDSERERLGLPHVKHPLRKEIIPAKTADEAFARFESMARKRLLAYAQRSLDTRDANEINAEFRSLAQKEAVFGTPDECIAQIAEIAKVLPIDPIVVRAQWPDMSADDVVQYLDDLGQIVPAIREIESIPRVGA
jgi:alkanesulfonate monooxygenase SsuD/methylene tetrahydromethanopterin reductase-like flavin-dependent oxidoreductase (luciferase family)